MGTTHALMGLLLGSTAYFIDPNLMVLAGVAGFIGGLLPDFDMPFDHRKTFHYPFYFTVLATALLPMAVLFPSLVTVFIFYLVASAAVHCFSDVFGGALEERPWEQTSRQAVYNHRREEWLQTHGGIRYDGAPEDFLLGLIIGATCFLIYSEPVKSLVVVTLAISLIYSVFRKKIVDWAPEWLKEVL